MGIIGALKGFAPLIVYGVGLALVLLCLSGRPQWALAFITALIPLRNVIEKLHRYPMGRDFVDILIFFILIGWSIYAVSNKKKFIDKSPINLIAIAIIIYTFFSTMYGSVYLGSSSFLDLGDERFHTWKNYATLPILFFITYNIIQDKIWVWRVVIVICAAMVLMDYYTVQQVMWFSSLESRNKLHGTFVYLGPNEVAAFYNQYTIVLLGIYYAMKRSGLKTALLILMLTNIFCILFLCSRAAYIALAMGLFLMFCYRNRILLFPLLLAAIFWQVALPEKVIDRIEQTHSESGELDESSRDRLEMWQISFELFSQSPIIGVGFDVFPHLGYYLGDTHNIYCRIISEQGLIGILLFFTILMIFFSQGMQLYATGDDDLSRGLGIGFAVAIVVLAINNFFGNRWTYMEISSNLWIFAGLVARMIKISAESKGAGKTETPRKLQPLHKRIKRHNA